MVSLFSLCTKPLSRTIQTKATKKFFPVVFLLIMLYKVVLTFGPVDEILKCDHSNESYWAILSCGTVYYAVQGGSYFWVCGWNPKVWPFKRKLLSSSFLWCFFVLTFDETPNSTTIKLKAAEHYVPVALQGGSNFWVCGTRPWSSTIQLLFGAVCLSIFWKSHFVYSLLVYTNYSFLFYGFLKRGWFTKRSLNRSW